MIFYRTRSTSDSGSGSNPKKLPKAALAIVLALAVAFVLVSGYSIPTNDNSNDPDNKDKNYNRGLATYSDFFKPKQTTPVISTTLPNFGTFDITRESTPPLITSTTPDDVGQSLVPVASKQPTTRPTSAPTSSPTCSISLPNNFTALAVVNLQFQPPENIEGVDTTFVIQQLTELFRSTYNRINNVKYTPCNEAYRKVQGVKQIDVSEEIENDDENNNIDGQVTYGEDEVPASFVFRRQLLQGEAIDSNESNLAAKSPSSSSPITTHYVRIGRPSSDEVKRRTQEQTEESNTKIDNEYWISISLLFEVTVACKGMFCLGDNAELFGPVVIDKNGFSRAYAENVARSLLWKPSTSGVLSGSGVVDATTNSSNSSSPLSFSTTVVVETVREIEEQSCPVNDLAVEFSKTVIVELVQESSKDPFKDLDDPRFVAILDAYVKTYNTLIRNEFCDPFFRRLTSAEVVAIGRNNAYTNSNANATATNKLVLPLEIRITGECKGCDPNDIDIYAAPSVLIGPTSSSSSNSRYLFGGSSNSNDDKWRLPSTATTTTTVTPDGRSLQEQRSNSINDKCYCDAQPFGNRAPFESEFVSRFQRTVEALNLEDFSSVNKCRFGTTFSTGLVVSFSKEDVQSLQDPNKNTKSILETSLKDTLNELLAITPKSCNKDFRVIENVTLVVGTNITRDYSNLLPPSATTTTQLSTIPNPSENDAAPLAVLNEGFRRSVQAESSFQWNKPVVRVVNDTASSSNTINCFDPAATNILTIIGCCENEKQESISVVNPNTNQSSVENTTTIQCYDPVEETSEAPTYSPFDPLSLELSTAANDNSANVLFFISGVCSGCDDTLLTGLTNDILRKLRVAATSFSASSPDLAPKSSRSLQEDVEEERAKSDCFCPINATETSGSIEASVLSESYKENLERDSIDSEVEILDEVEVVECEDVVNEFSTTATMTLAGDLTDSDMHSLATSFKDTYNYLNALYCDPYFRTITDIEDVEVFAKRKRNRKSRRRRKLDEDCITETEIEIYVKGTCLGCRDGQPLFDGHSRYYNRRRRDLKSLFDSYKLTTFHNAGIRRNSRRRLQESDVCFCEGDTFADRAPSFDEFFEIYENEAESVPAVCEVVDIEVSEDESFKDYYDDDEEQFDDYYEEFFVDSLDETSTVPPDFFVDTEFPTDSPTEPEEEEKEDDRETFVPPVGESEELDDEENENERETLVPSFEESEELDDEENENERETLVPSFEESEEPDDEENENERETLVPSFEESEEPDDEENENERETLVPSFEEDELDDDSQDLNDDFPQDLGDDFSQDLDEDFDESDNEFEEESEEEPEPENLRNNGFDFDTSAPSSEESEEMTSPPEEEYDDYENIQDDGSDAGYDDGVDDGMDFGYDDEVDFGSDDGYDDVFDDGSDAGYDDGVDLGYDDGFDDGVDFGYDDGFDDGVDLGYDGGFDDGFDDGF